MFRACSLFWQKKNIEHILSRNLTFDVKHYANIHLLRLYAVVHSNMNVLVGFVRRTRQAADGWNGFVNTTCTGPN